MKVLITNTLALNGGEAAMIHSLAHLLRLIFGDDIDIAIYDQEAEPVSKYYLDLTFRTLLYYHVSRVPRIRGLRAIIGRLNRMRFLAAAKCLGARRDGLARRLLTRREHAALTDYHSADLIISGGGTYLVENYDLRPRIFDYEVTLALKRPLVFFTQSMGPFRKPEHRKKLRRILDQALLVLLRDKASVSHLRDLGVSNPNVHVSSDVVFLLAEDSHRPETRPFLRRVAISVRNWPHFKTVDAATGMKRYRDAIDAVTRYLVEKHGASVTFVSTCQGIPEYFFDDSKMAKEIVDSLEPSLREKVEVDRTFRQPLEMLEHLRSFDFVITTRFHMAILALIAGVPPFAISYEFKTDELYRELDLAEWALSIENIDGPALTTAVGRCIEQRKEACRELPERVASQADRVLEAGALLRTLFQGLGCGGAIAGASRDVDAAPGLVTPSRDQVSR
jgi:colanic acid/amylovoran biosynthesis protein